MSDQRTTLVTLATYNERENLPSLVDAIKQHLPAADILVVDDNSPDGTGGWCDERAAADPHFRCLHREGKLGLGSATMAGFSEAIAAGYKLVATMDADWSHAPESLPNLIAATQSADVAIGSRYCPGGQIEGWPLVRRLVSRVMNTLTRVLLRLPVRDTSGAFRVYRVAALKRLDLAEINETGYAYLEEIAWRLRHAGATFAEVPITFRERRAGQSKVNAGEVLGKLRMLARCWLSNP